MAKTELEEEFKEVQIEIAETEKTLQELRNRLDEIVQQIRNS
jgi:hypothetical protein